MDDLGRACTADFGDRVDPDGQAGGAGGGCTAGQVDPGAWRKQRDCDLEGGRSGDDDSGGCVRRSGNGRAAMYEYAAADYPRGCVRGGARSPDLDLRAYPNWGPTGRWNLGWASD